MKNSFSRIGAKIWNSVLDSDRVLPKYKFKNTLQSRLLDNSIQEDTYVGLRTLLTYLVNINYQFNFIHTLFHLPILKYMYSLSC